MKYARRSTPGYWGVRSKGLHRATRSLRFRELGVGLFFLSLVLLFAGFFSNVYGMSRVMSPSSPLAIKSTVGTQGVSSPFSNAKSAKDAGNGAKVAILGVTTQLQSGTDSVVPPKPAWTHRSLYTDSTNEATQFANANPTYTDVSYIARAGQVPVAQWFGDWNSNVQSDADAYVSAAASAGEVPVLVLYNIPLRDCGGYSTGGATSLSAYTQWVRQVAAGIGNRTAVIILEPDALGALDCLPTAAQQQERYQSISQGVTILKSLPQTFVYIDAGTPVWQSVATMKSRLNSANIASADGFSLNVSYFASNSANAAYGDELSSAVGNKHFVIDTSRNGTDHPVSGAICNPSFASFGTIPTTDTGNSRIDAFLWIKIPWESDGPCNGSPGPGVVYWSYAIQLAKNAGW